MTAKEKLAALKAGKRITTSDGKTTHSYKQGKTTVTAADGRTTTTTKAGQGWKIDTGTQKKTTAPRAKAHKPSPKSTAGRSIKYYGGKSNVVDLGHNPTKSAISKATVKLNTAKKTTKPKAPKNSSASVPKLTVPQTGAPTTTPDTKDNTAGKIVAIGTAVVGTGLAVGAGVALNRARKPAEVGLAKPVGPIVPLAKAKPLSELKLKVGLAEPQKGLPGRVTLPETPKGLPGAEKPTRRQIVDDLRSKSAPKVAKVTPPSSITEPVKVTGASTWAARGERGKTVELTVTGKAKAPAVAKIPKVQAGTQSTDTVKIPKAPKIPKADGSGTVKVGTHEVSARDVATQAPKQVVSSRLNNEGAFDTTITKVGSDVQAEANNRVTTEDRRKAGRRDQGARQTKAAASNANANHTAPKQSSRRGQEQRRNSGAAEVAKVTVPTPGDRRSDTETNRLNRNEIDHIKQMDTLELAEEQRKVNDQIKHEPAREKLRREGAPAQPKAPKVAKVTVPSATEGFGATEAEVAKVATSGQAVTPPNAEQKLANAKAVAGAPQEVQDLVAQVDKAAGTKVGKVGPAPQANAAPAPAAVTDPKAVYDGARAAIRSKDPVAVKKALEDLRGVGDTKKSKKFTPELEGILASGAHTPEPPKAPEVEVAKVTTPDAPKANEAPRPAEVAIAGVQAGTADAQAAYKEARDALRSGDASRMKAVVGKLPKNTKKTKTWTKNLEAGILAAGNRPPSTTPAPKADAPAPEAPKAEAPKVAKLDGVPAGDPMDAASIDDAYANQAQRAADAADDERRAGDRRSESRRQVSDRFTQKEAGEVVEGRKAAAKGSTRRGRGNDPRGSGKNTGDLLADAQAENANLKGTAADKPNPASYGDSGKDSARYEADKDMYEGDKEARKGKAEVAKVEAPTEPMRGTTPAETTAAAGNLRNVEVESAPMGEDAAKRARDKAFYRAQKKLRREARDASIREKGIATIPLDAEAGDVEIEEVKQRKIQNDLLDARAKVADGGKVTAKPEAKAVGSDTDKRPAEYNESDVRVMEPGPRDLETEHGGGRAQGTISDIINEDADVRDKRNEGIRNAANKARTIAASRNASPEQDAALENKIKAEYDRSLELYFDDVETDSKAHNQAGPRKPDARTMFLDPMIDADAELGRERGAAGPPAPSDRTTIDQKIAEVRKRMAPGGESIYNGEDTIKQLEALRDQKPAEVKPPRSTRVLAPPADLTTEHLDPKTRPSVGRAGLAGTNAGASAARDKRVSGKSGPVNVPDMTKPGVIPAGPTTPPATPAKEHARVEGKTKTMTQLWSGRMADWGRAAYQAQVKRLTSPMLDVAGGHAKATGKAAQRVKTGAKVGAGLGLATLAFTALGATEAGANEPDPKKRVQAGVDQFKVDLPGTAKDIVKFTAADYGVTKVIPGLAARAATFLGANATKAAFTRGLTAAAGRAGLAGYIGYHALPYTGKKLAELAYVGNEARKSSNAAAKEKKGSEAKYGTVEQATKTRHAKEALKRKQKADKAKGKA